MRKRRKETGLRRMAVALAIFTALVVGYDVWCLASDNAKEGLYILPLALAAFVGILAKIISVYEKSPPGSGPIGRWGQRLTDEVRERNEHEARLQREAERQYLEQFPSEDGSSAG